MYAWLELAKKDMKVVNLMLDTVGNDEVYINIIAYHVQQSIEKILKQVIEYQGNIAQKTHQTSQLIKDIKDIKDILGEDDIDLLYESIDSFDNWATKTRYVVDYTASYKQVRRLNSLVNRVYNSVVLWLDKQEKKAKEEEEEEAKSKDTRPSIKNLNLFPNDVDKI